MSDQVTQSQWTDKERASWRHCCTLDQMRGWWKGSDCVVVAGGPSARVQPREYEQIRDIAAAVTALADNYHTHWTIGCNRAVTTCRPDFAACFEQRKDRDVWDVVLAAGVPFVLSHISRDHPRTVITGPKMDVVSWITGDTPKTGRHPNEKGDMWLGQSTFCAIAAAVVLGFDTIAVIGLDLTDDRFGRRLLMHSEKCYAGLLDVAQDAGSRLINLNPHTNLQAIPIGSWTEVRTK